MALVKAYGVNNPKDRMHLLNITRRDIKPDDVSIQIMYCGICHSDIHTARNEWPGTLYPCVPGHEIVGKVLAKGANVSRFAVGEFVGVGCLVDSCGACSSCDDGEEQYCEKGFVGTYNGYDPELGHTLGGYSQSIVVKESFVLKINHDHSQLAAVAPLLCAGITTYSPLKYWGAGPGKKVGVVGLGGLGHMGVKLAKAMGAHVVLFTRSLQKKEDALKLGADEVCIYDEKNGISRIEKDIDIIINTVSVPHNLDMFLSLLRKDGTMVLVGAPGEPHTALSAFNLILTRGKLAGSLIGGVRETQEMLDFCAKHNIVADIELIPISYLNEAYERTLKAEIKYRFVINMESFNDEVSV